MKLLLLLAAFLPVQDKGEPTLAERSSKFFRDIVDIRAEKKALVLRLSITKDDLGPVFKDMWTKFQGFSLSYSYPGGSGSGGGGRRNGLAVIDFQKASEGVFRIQLNDLKRADMLRLSQDAPGRLQLIYEGPGELFTVYRQNEKGCRLIVITGDDVKVLKAETFEKLSLDHPEEVSAYLLEPIERYIDRAPLTAMSGEVVKIALELAWPGNTDELDELIESCDAESVIERDEAAKTIEEKVKGSMAARHYIASRAAKLESDEARSRLQDLLKSDSEIHRAYSHLIEQKLHRNLSYYVRLLSAGKKAGPRLRALTGREFETADEWTSWIRKTTLRWDEAARRYVEETDK